jgi:histidinol dehydrogenase
MAASRGCLSPLDFLKMRVEVRGCGRLPDDLLSAMLTFAREEGFEYHAKSLEARMRRQG